MKTDVKLLLTFFSTLVLFLFYQAGYSIGKRAADRWWGKMIVNSPQAWPANDIRVHPPYSRATVDDLLCGKIGVYVYDHCESEEFYRSKDLPCYDKKGALIPECSKHTDTGWSPPKPTEVTAIVGHPKDVLCYDKQGRLISGCSYLPENDETHILVNLPKPDGELMQQEFCTFLKSTLTISCTLFRPVEDDSTIQTVARWRKNGAGVWIAELAWAEECASTMRAAKRSKRRD